MRKSLINKMVLIVIFYCLLPITIYACSGPGAGALIERNRKVVTTYGIIALVAIFTTIAFYFLRRRKGLPAIIVSLIFVFFHPVWYYGGGGGDCGRSMAEMAKYVTIVLAAIFIIQVALWKFRRPDFQTSRA